VPDDTGFHQLTAFDSSDPETPDSGSGVLARVTLRAVGSGDSRVSFGSRDLDEDGKPDKGTLLRDSDAQSIGDLDEDNLFDGESTDAEVAVDQDCPAGTLVAPGPPSSGGGSLSWMAVGGASAAVVAVLAVATVLFLSRRNARRRALPDESS
jgi:hypothetical protein